MQPRQYVPILPRPEQPPAAAQNSRVNEDDEGEQGESNSTTPSAAYNHWTSEDDAVVARLRSEGVVYSQIGKRLGRTQNAVGRRVAFLKKKDKEREGERELVEGEKEEEEEEDEEKEKSTATSSLGKPLRRFTADEDLLLAALDNEGKNNKQIGEALGRTSTVVSQRRNILKENGKWEDLVGAASDIGPRTSTLADSRSSSTTPSAIAAKVPWSKADSALLRSSILEGKDWPAVAAALGRTQRSCKKRWKQRRERWESEGASSVLSSVPFDLSLRLKLIEGGSSRVQVSSRPTMPFLQPPLPLPPLNLPPPLTPTPLPLSSPPLFH